MATTYFTATQLLSPPSERAAFSDRQAYVCAELSRLAYFKFEGGHTLAEALEIARTVFGDDKRLNILEKQLSVVLSTKPSTAADGKLALGKILQGANFDLVDVIDEKGAEGFFCTKTVKLDSGTNKVLAYMVFRGTEPKDFNDIKADARAALAEAKVGNETLSLHSGFYGYFLNVEKKVKELLGTPYDQLFLTGHSLGGALAQVTTRILASSVNGACYTFGAPPIGTADVQNNLKTPVYEIINEIDIVPRLPNPWLATGLLFLLRFLRVVLKGFTIVHKTLFSGSWDEKLEKFFDAMTKYRHPGYQSYLVGGGQSARLRINVAFFDRMKWYLAILLKSRIWHFKKMVSDHSIEVYVEKLKAHGMNRL